MSDIEWVDEDDPKLREMLGHALRAGYRYRDGRDSEAPALIFADCDYEVGDGSCGLREDGKYCNEPAIVYVRADAYVEAASRIRELEKQAKMLEDDNRALRSSKYNYQRLRHIANDKRDAALADNERLREALGKIARDAKEASRGRYTVTALLDVEYDAVLALKGEPHDT